MKVELHADLDVPGETGRQARVFLLWIICLVSAVSFASCRASAVMGAARAETGKQQAFERGRRVRISWGLFLGLAVPALLTLFINHRHRRGGAHARGIAIDITEEGELRLWGRGYGQRVQLDGSTVNEYLVNAYCGRLGSWRQRRLRVRGRGGGRSTEIVIATPAIENDNLEDLTEYPGEGDCIEVERKGYESVRNTVFELTAHEEAVR